jgi:hypothetical protein
MCAQHRPNATRAGSAQHGSDTGTVGAATHLRVVTTEEVTPDEAFARWQDLISNTFVPLVAAPTTDRPFRGRVVHSPVGQVELTTVRANGQHGRRTSRLIARRADDYVLASIQVAGCGEVKSGLGRGAGDPDGISGREGRRRGQHPHLAPLRSSPPHSSRWPKEMPDGLRPPRALLKRCDASGLSGAAAHAVRAIAVADEDLFEAGTRLGHREAVGPVSKS